MPALCAPGGALGPFPMRLRKVHTCSRLVCWYKPARGDQGQRREPPGTPPEKLPNFYRTSAGADTVLFEELPFSGDRLMTYRQQQRLGMRNSHRPPLDSPPDDLVEAVVRVCENPGTFWSDANAQCALDGEVNQGRGFVLTRAGFHRSDDPEATLTQSTPLLTQPFWLCYLWEPVYISADAVRATLSLFGPDLCAATGIGPDGHRHCGPGTDSEPGAESGGAVGTAPVVCGTADAINYGTRLASPSQASVAGAPLSGGMQAMGSPAILRLFPHCRHHAGDGSPARISPNVDPRRVSRLLSRFTLSECDLLFVLHYAEAALSNPLSGACSCQGKGRRSSGAAPRPAHECNLFDLLGIPHSEVLSHVTGRTQSFRDLVTCQPEPPRSQQVAEDSLNSMDIELQGVDISDLPEECFVSYSTMEDRADETGEIQDSPSDSMVDDPEAWVKREFEYSTDQRGEAEGGTWGGERGAVGPDAGHNGAGVRGGYGRDEDRRVVLTAMREGRPLSGHMADLAREILGQRSEGARSVPRGRTRCEYVGGRSEYVYAVDGVVDSQRMAEEFR